MRRRLQGRGAALVRTMLVALAALVAGGALAVSLIPQGELKALLDAGAVDGDAGLTPARHASLVLQLRLLALAVAGAAVALVLARRRFDAAARRLGSSAARCASSLREQLGRVSERGERLDVVSLAGLLGLAVALRAVYLDVPLRYDEATTFNNFASEPLYVAVSNYATPNNHVLHTLLVSLSTTLLGDAEWAIRLPALAAGILLVPAGYVLGRILHGRTAGLMAAAVLATASPFVEYSTNARGYTLVTLLALVLFATAPAVLATDEAAGWLALGFVAAVGAFTVPVMLFPFGGLLVWVVLTSVLDAQRPLGWALRRVGALAAVAGLLSALLYLPVLVASGPRSLAANEYVAPRGFRTFASELGDALAETLASWQRGVPVPLALAAAAAAAAGVLLHRRISRFTVAPAAAALLWTFPVVLAQRAAPFPRVLLFLLALAILTAAGAGGAAVDKALSRRPTVRRGAGSATAFVIAAVSAAFLLASDSPRSSRETGALLDAPAVTRFLVSYLRAGDTLVATGSDTILEYYLRRAGLEPAPYLYGRRGDGRLVFVVNVFGGQTLSHLLEDPRLPGHTETHIRLLRSYPSARVYVASPTTG